LLGALYDGALRYVDQCVGELAAVLREQGVWDSTLVVVTADHGESLGEHGILGHAFGMHDTLLRVPLLMRCPATLPAGFVIDELAQTTDIMPTISSMIGSSGGAPHVPGRCLIRDGRVTPGPDFVVAERFRARSLPGAPPTVEDVRMKVIRTRHEKFLWRSDEANELYDIAADPQERHNIIELATNRADALRRQLFDWLASVESFHPVDDLERQEAAMLGSTA
jgi:arylsulfatase A-like enzyme